MDKATFTNSKSYAANYYNALIAFQLPWIVTSVNFDLSPSGLTLCNQFGDNSEIPVNP